MDDALGPPKKKEEPAKTASQDAPSSHENANAGGPELEGPVSEEEIIDAIRNTPGIDTNTLMSMFQHRFEGDAAGKKEFISATKKVASLDKATRRLSLR
eukprot:CAMPEP_0114565120 /NCGR_PEP_ID=MMETSP0114-20121206/14125_1 /TAXON_ID=31324 /ORGANISM="Goniomonas sp, Strain m" /LENGTH=98 /DNA_ID=CAMNT_0001751315 /DNA_START=159 /DNA_END=451 /DNA_ORIENTATION=+